MKTIYIFLNRTTGQLIQQQGANEYIARQLNPLIGAHDVLYQVILESNSYVRVITYKVDGYWQEIDNIQQTNK